MDWKGFFSRNKIGEGYKNFKRKLKFNKLLDKDGFYIIMFLCVCIVGASAVWVAKTNIDRLAGEDINRNDDIVVEDTDIWDVAEKEMENQIDDILIVDSEEDIEKEASGDNIVQREIPQDENEENITINSGKVLVEESSEPKIIITKAPPKPKENIEVLPAASDEVVKPVMAWPVKGEIGMEYAVETLTYSKTLEHYTTHHGIDIIAEENTPVKAALGGEVIEVLTDSRLGITITIDHGDNLLTRYSNLCTDAMVKVGDIVVQGQTISGVGTTAVFESAEEPHLHFEVLKNNENVNPMEYLAME